VDPHFNISFRKKIKWILKVPQNLNNKYFEETSDIFFLKRRKYLQKIRPVDVVLVDGLHTFETSLNDVLNSLKFINKEGIIIMHDCLPPHKVASLPIADYSNIGDLEKNEGWTDEWCGDVWKTIVYLRKKYSDSLDICVINTDYGLGIVKPKKKFNEEELAIDIGLFNDIDKLTYENLLNDVDLLLNLKEPAYAFKIVKEISEPKRNKN